VRELERKSTEREPKASRINNFRSCSQMSRFHSILRLTRFDRVMSDVKQCQHLMLIVSELDSAAAQGAIRFDDGPQHREHTSQLFSGEEF